MKTLSGIKDLKGAVCAGKLSGKSIGLVPTMGFFHDGHLSLIRESVNENDITIVSVFVNPVQFGPGEDFARYPRDPAKDKARAEEAGADYFFTPSSEEMYPEGYGTFVEAEALGRKLCGLTRPGHFRGVATVVVKLINICSPSSLYLGQKDAQQAVVLRKMINDFNIGVNVRILPTIREKDGLAMSSRNKYLSQAERAAAPNLYRALSEAKQSAERGGISPNELVRLVRKRLSEVPGMGIDYIEAVSTDSLDPAADFEKPVLLAAAVKLGGARLIDNVLINSGGL